MMNILFRQEHPVFPNATIAALEYREVDFESSGTAGEPKVGAPTAETATAPPGIALTPEELELRLRRAAAEGARAREESLRQEFEFRLEGERTRITAAIETFHRQQTEYYAQVEPELVHLALAVAAKILHREAQVDRMLLAALAKVAVESLQQRSHVVLRVPTEVFPVWREYFAEHLTGTKVEVLEDSQLERDACVLETELGSAEVGIDAQLKEIERGFFDLLAKRPEPR